MSSLAESGVSTDIWTSYAARIMVISVIPFIIVQLPQLLNSTSGRHVAVLIALVVSVSMFIIYCLYQVLFLFLNTCSFTVYSNFYFHLLKYYIRTIVGSLIALHLYLVVI